MTEQMNDDDVTRKSQEWLYYIRRKKVIFCQSESTNPYPYYVIQACIYYFFPTPFQLSLSSDPSSQDFSVSLSLSYFPETHPRKKKKKEKNRKQTHGKCGKLQRNNIFF